MNWRNMRLSKDSWSPLGKYVWLALLALVVVGILISFWYVANERDFTSLESYFLQVFVAFVGVAGSFYSGRQSAREAAREVVNTHARSAFRLLLSLRSGLTHLSFIIGSSHDSVSSEDYEKILAELKGVVYMQQLMVVDALGGWEDITPEEMERLKERLSAEKTTEVEE